MLRVVVVEGASSCIPGGGLLTSWTQGPCLLHASSSCLVVGEVMRACEGLCVNGCGKWLWVRVSQGSTLADPFLM